MTALDLTTLTADFFSVLKTDTAGAAVRALLGDGANSVLTAQDLVVATLPAPPFVMLRGGPATGDRFQKRDAFFTWYVYDDMRNMWRRINAILALIEAVYTDEPDLTIPWFVIHLGSTSQEVTDRTLMRSVRSLGFQLSTRT